MISIIIPTYNEKENIIILIRQIKKTLDQNKHEIIIVDDDSSDGTYDVAKKYFRKDKQIRIFRRRKEKGLGTAILFGLGRAKGSVIVGIDADFNHDPKKIPKLVAGLDKHDIVIASRFIKGGGMEDKNRYSFTYIFNLFLKYLLGFPTMDNMSGYYAIKKETLFNLPLHKIYTGYGEYHLKLLYFMQKKSLIIGEIPTFYKKRRYGKSKSNLLKMFFRYLSVVFKLKFDDERV